MVLGLCITLSLLGLCLTLDLDPLNHQKCKELGFPLVGLTLILCLLFLLDLCLGLNRLVMNFLGERLSLLQ